MARFDLPLAFDASLLDLLGSGLLRRGSIAFLSRIYDDALKLGLFVEEIRDIKKCVALQSDVYKGRLHAGQHAHYATFVEVSHDALILFAAFDVELGNAVVFDNRDLFFAAVDTNN